MNGLHPDLVGKLAAAGFGFVEVVDTRDDLVPVLVARYVTQLYPEDGRQDINIDHDVPDLGAAISTEWERLAAECGLFSVTADGRREFLVGIDTAVDVPDETEFEAHRWVRVTMADAWDIAGAGCESGILGVGRNNPTFMMASLNGDVVMISGYWQIGIGIGYAPRPERIAELREQARRVASYTHMERAQRDWAERWLAALES
ncbi:hypothetical protein AB0N28_21500 [Streptomyces sp. NPDC051130]|uniref:hypothetical protein n=1 Tax=Streptomyces sp. NPDC051130 TaxID=3157223 RepID=UPI00342FA5AC